MAPVAQRGDLLSTPSLAASYSPSELLSLAGGSDLGKTLLQPEDPHIIAVASDAALDLPVPVLAMHDIAAVARFVLAHAAPF